MVIGGGITLLGHDGHGERVAKGLFAETNAEREQSNQKDVLIEMEDLIVKVKEVEGESNVKTEQSECQD
jgi:hypothetical protein